MPIPCFTQNYEIADDYRSKAKALYEQDNYNEAAAMYAKSVEAEKNNPYPREKNLSSALFMAGYCYYKYGNNNDALKYFEESLEIIRKLDNEADIAKILHHIGEVYYSMKQYDESLQFYNQAIRIYEKLGNEEYIAVLLSDIGVVYYNKKQYDEAIKYHKQALVIDKKLGNENDEAGILYFIGRTYEACEQFDKSIQFYEKALAIYRTLEKESTMAILTNKIGIIYESMGLYDKSVKYFEETLIIRLKRSLPIKGDIPEDILKSLMKIWNNYKLIGQDKKILEDILADALEKIRLENEATLLLNSALNAFKEENYETALKYIQESLNIHKDIETSENVIAKITNLTGWICEKLDQPEKALSYYEEALEIRRELNISKDIAESLTDIGDVQKSLHYYDKALTCYGEALELYWPVIDFKGISDKSRDIEISKAITTILDDIGHIYHILGQYEKALLFYEEAYIMKLKNNLIDENILESLANIETSYESLGKEKTFDIITENAANKNKSVNEALELNNQGIVAYQQARPLEAIALFEKSININKTVNYPRGILINLYNISAIHQSLGNYEKALKSYEDALMISRELRTFNSIASILSNIGAIYCSFGKYEEALEYHKEALEIFEKRKMKKEVAKCFNNLGIVYLTCHQYDKAIKYFQDALIIARALGQEDLITTCLNYIGFAYRTNGQYDNALKDYMESLEIVKKFEKDANLAPIINSLGSLYEDWGQYNNAIEYYEIASYLNRRTEKDEIITKYLNNIGGIYYDWGKYGEAIGYYEESLDIDRKQGIEENIAFDLNNIGLVYKAWGNYDKAIHYYEQALVINKRLKKQENIAENFNNIGEVYSTWFQYDKAISNYEQALIIFKEQGNDILIAKVLNNIGLVHYALDKYDFAIKHYKEALDIFKKHGKEESVATLLNNIGQAYSASKQYNIALQYYEEALYLDKKMGREPDIARDYSNIGALHYKIKKYYEAIESLKESIELKEKLRKTATGDIRRDYLDSQISTYQYLTSTYIRNNDVANAFNIMEISRSKLLIENIVAFNSAINIPTLIQVQKNLNENSAIIIFANVNWDEKIQLVLTKERIYGLEISDDSLLTLALKAYEQSITEMLAYQKRFNNIIVKEKDVLKGQVKKNDDFENIINYYRNLLISTFPDKISKANELGKILYDYLISPVAELIEDKKELIIVPDGILAFLPFETLVDKNGQYLVEKYDVKYAHSMTVLDLIKKRDYEKDRKPLLAFGGAIYDEMAYSGDTVNNEAKLIYLEKNVYSAISRDSSVRDAYASLGEGTLENLPGTLSEVNSIAKTVKGSEVITDSNVTEEKIKNLSASGELSKYKVLHFATHGLVVQSIPGLSALVLSQVKKEQGNEDGYLRMGEIAELDIRADFVNLSACNTGLGKIFNGEGVVGLTQSFLIAGGNALSVSLWQVADISTSKFMLGLYILAEKETMDYYRAMSEMKRKFIAGEFGDDYKAPFYWAPFVYYGK